MKKLLSTVLAIIMVVSMIIPVSAASAKELNFKDRHTFAEYESTLKNLSKDYSEITELFSLGTTWRENNIWCLKITNKTIDDSKKTGIAVIANIHGGEQEGGESALYSAIALCKNSTTKEIKEILDGYIIYIVPVMNPDGYIQSFVLNNRPNLHPTDKNGDGVSFSDPYTDINGDGFISTVYKGKKDTKIEDRIEIGMESPDWDKNGKLGDDPRSSGIDLNRTFEYNYGRYDIETDPEVNKDSKSVIGQDATRTNGKGKAAGMEPEVKAIQRFFAKYPVDAMTSVHTGQQSVLYPWCYRAYDPNNELDSQIPHMKEVSEKLAKIYTDYTGRNFYAKQSHSDYPTSAEMIDYTYGRHRINSYTIEVYGPGMSDPNSEDIFERSLWNNKLPETKWQFYDQKQIKNELKLDPKALGLKDGEGLWFEADSWSQMSGKAPEDQDVMVEGFYKVLVELIKTEEPGGNNNYVLPEYLK